MPLRISTIGSVLPTSRRLPLPLRGLPSRGGSAQAMRPMSIATVHSPPFFAFSPVRTRMLDELGAAPRPPAKLLAVSAPTGYGKTVFLSRLFDHYRSSGAECQWLALDDRDTTVERLLTLLEGVLLPGIESVDPGQALHQGDRSVDERIAAVIESLSHAHDPAVLFIDNLNYCVDETLSALIDALVFSTPSWVHLVLSSTTDLPFDRARARLEGRVRSIGYNDLSLNAGEIAQLLGTELSERIGAVGLNAIIDQTEGWPAAVRLMQILLASAVDPLQALQQFSGADEDLADLLNRQILHQLDPASRQFLLEIAPLRVFGVNLCRQATGDDRAADHVRRLLKDNLFVIPLDRNRSWYRLHALFREFLIDEAERQVPAARRYEVLCRAAEWCEHAGRWQDAIDYALMAERGDLAAAILERVAAMFVRDRGDLNQYIEWVERLHRMGVRGGWEVDYWYVWALVFHRRYEFARRQMELVSQRLRSEAASQGRVDEAEHVQRRIDVISFTIDTYTDRHEDALRLAMRWLPPRPDDDPFDVATVAAGSCFQLVSRHQLTEARSLLRLAQSHIAQAQSAYGESWVAIASASVAIYDDDYSQVHQDLIGALAKSRAQLGDNAGISGTLAIVASKSAIESGRDDEARELLMLGMRRIESHGIVETALLGLDAAIKLWNGDDLATLNRYREIAAAYPPRAALGLSCFIVRRLLRLGRYDEALVEAAQIGLVPERGIEQLASAEFEQFHGMRAMATAVLIELDIAGGRLKAATALIADETRNAKAVNRSGRLVELALDEAAITLCSHNPAPAARHLARAVSLAAKRRYIRPFRDRAELVAALVNETKSKDWGFAVEEERRFFAEICRGLPLGQHRDDVELDADSSVHTLAETPTARELELLMLVEAGLSNQQLADRLSLSVATVKWHLYNLYTKLGMSSRGAALARARALNLLVR